MQTFGRKKSAIAVSYCKKGRGLVKINGCPIELVEPETLRYKVFEPILLLGRERFSIMDLRIRVKGGGYTSQVYGACIAAHASGTPIPLSSHLVLTLPSAPLPAPLRSHPASDCQVSGRLLPEMCATCHHGFTLPPL